MSSAGASFDLQREFALEHQGGNRYRREISEDWRNATDAIFGGYAAALCLAAAASESRHDKLSSGHVMFIAPTKPGPIEFEISPIRQGRSFSALRVSGFQGSREVLGANAWFLSSAATLTAGIGREPPPLPPSAANCIPWLDEYPFYRWMETVAIDYPAQADGFVTETYRPIDVWSRARDARLPAGLMTQLFDVLLADAHTADGAARWPDFFPEQTISLDLHMQWAAGSHQPGWRRLLGNGTPPRHGLAACTATIFDEDGVLCATASQQAWSRHGA